MPSDPRPVRVGRPRRALDSASGLSPREQILDAAAALFVERGFSATTTRAIAERVGIRQASLYYHFPGKDELLVELLTTSVRPSLEIVAGLEESVPASVSAAAALYTLVVVDVGTLARAPHNIGTLYLLPEVQGERYDAFRLARRDLQEAYARLGAAAATGETVTALGTARLGALLIQLTETVIQLRRAGADAIDAADTAAIAASCLRICGLDAAAIASARRESEARETRGSADSGAA